MPRHVVRDFVTCLLFNGTSSGVQSNNWLAVNSNITISCWAKWRKNTTTRQPLFINGRGVQDNPGVPPYDKGYALVINGNGTTDGSLYILDENVAWTSCAYKVTDRNWHHYILILDASGFPIVYVDGAVIFQPGSGSVSVPSVTSGTLTSTIGNDDAGVGVSGFFNGLIDDVQIYNTAFTATQASNLYYGRSLDVSPISRYKFDEGSGSTAIDSGSSPKNGVITSATYSSDVFMVARTVVS